MHKLFGSRNINYIHLLKYYVEKKASHKKSYDKRNPLVNPLKICVEDMELSY